MADLGDVALRLLDPRWSTVVGTVREWTSTEHWGSHTVLHDRSRPGFGPGPWAMGRGASGLSVSLVASSGPPDPQRPGESEVWRRLWVRRDGRSRIEHRSSAGADTWLTEIRAPDTMHQIRADGFVTVGDAGFGPGLPTWLLDPGPVVGSLRLRFGDEDVFAGRPVVQASADARRDLTRLGFPIDPMFLGMPLGGHSELTIDVATGIVLRFATYEGARLIGLRQFIDLTVDEPVADELVTFALAPGQRFRTPLDDQIELLQAAGVDTADLDGTDEVAVQQAMDDHHRQQAELHRTGPFGRRERPLVEIIAPLGPLPDDEAAAREAIEAAVNALGAAPEDGVAGVVDRGELFDALPPQPPHPAMQGQTASFILDDLAFVRDDEAVIAFTIRLSGGGSFGGGGFPSKGRAVRRGDRWLVSYDTWANLQQMGGSAVPSLFDHPD